MKLTPKFQRRLINISSVAARAMDLARLAYGDEHFELLRAAESIRRIRDEGYLRGSLTESQEQELTALSHLVLFRK